MLKVFGLENAGNASPSDRNWQLFDLNSKTTVKTDLVFTNPVSTPTIDKSVFVLYGPIVLFNIMISLDTGDGWDATTYIKMPFQALNVATALEFEGNFIVSNPATGGIYTEAYMGTNENLMFAGPYTAPSSKQARIQGWYFRN